MKNKTTRKAAHHPVQPLVRDSHGTTRFKENKIVRYLLDLCRAKGVCDLNALEIIDFPREDREQFLQLIGYSLSGFGEWDCVRDSTYDAAASQPVHTR